MSDLIIRDANTGESRTFTPTAAGYAEADAYKRTILESGHCVSDDGSGSFMKIDGFFRGNGNAGRSGDPKKWW